MEGSGDDADPKRTIFLLAILVEFNGSKCYVGHDSWNLCINTFTIIYICIYSIWELHEYSVYVQEAIVYGDWLNYDGNFDCSYNTTTFATLYGRFLGFLRMDFDPLAHEFTSFVAESMYNILLNSADMHAISQVSVSTTIWTPCSFYQQHLVGDCGVK